MTTFEELDEQEDPFSAMVKAELVTMIRWADRQNPRSQQVLVGPSEIGGACDRRIGYRLAEVPAVNVDFDPWAAVVGTAVHSWLERAARLWVRHHDADLVPETRLTVDQFVQGTADLYSKRHKAVIDYKGVGPDGMRKLRRDGPPTDYQTQVHVYGYGFEQQGWPVEKVVLAFFPRAGWIKDMFVWSADYDRSVAQKAVARLYQIAQNLVDLDILTESNSHRWEQVDASPSNNCGWCPWYDPGRSSERGADTTGCPGR